MEGTALSGWPSCTPYFLSSPESSLPNIWSTHLARTSAYWGHPISNQLPPPLRDFLSREAALLPLALQAEPASKAFTSWSTSPGVLSATRDLTYLRGSGRTRSGRWRGGILGRLAQRERTQGHWGVQKLWIPGCW